MALTTPRLRLEVDISDRTWKFQDVLSIPMLPRIYAGSLVSVEVGFFVGHDDSSKTIVSDFSDLKSVTIAAKKSDLSGEYLIGPKIGGQPVAISQDEWDTKNPEKTNLVFTLTDADTNITAQDLWLVIYGVTQGDEIVVLGTTTLTVIETSITESDTQLTAGQRTRVSLPFQLQDPSSLLWYTLSLVTGDDGKPTLNIAANGEGDVTGRTRPQYPFQLAAADGWHTLTISIVNGQPVLSISENAES